MPQLEKGEEFNSHVSKCQQCEERPFDLCSLGKALLVSAAAEAMLTLERGNTRAQPLPAAVRTKRERSGT